MYQWQIEMLFGTFGRPLYVNHRITEETLGFGSKTLPLSVDNYSFFETQLLA